MEWIRNWAMQVAGITVIAAICDAIMPRGNMQKYVRMVIGLILIIVLIGPLSSITSGNFGVGIDDSRTHAAELKNSMTENERKTVLKLYRQKLAESMDNELRTANICAENIDIDVEETDDKHFGDITKASVTLDKTSKAGDADATRALLCKKFGIERSRIYIFAP